MIQCKNVNTEGGDIRLETESHTSTADNVDTRHYPASAPFTTARVPGRSLSRYHGVHIEGLEWEIQRYSRQETHHVGLSVQSGLGQFVAT